MPDVLWGGIECIECMVFSFTLRASENPQDTSFYSLQDWPSAIYIVLMAVFGSDTMTVYSFRKRSRAMSAINATFAALTTCSWISHFRLRSSLRFRLTSLQQGTQALPSTRLRLYC